MLHEHALMAMPQMFTQHDAHCRETVNPTLHRSAISTPKCVASALMGLHRSAISTLKHFAGALMGLHIHASCSSQRLFCSGGKADWTCPPPYATQVINHQGLL
jgi:hypothetical protein